MRNVVCALVLLGCGPADNDEGGSAGNAGSSGGNGGTTGGSAGTAPKCDEMWTEYEALRDSALRCDVSATPAECDTSDVVFDNCGCSTPANPSSPDYAEARRLGVEYFESCDFPENCVDCPATRAAGCVADGEFGVCVYQ
jgi:hypothetical protein